MSASPAGLTPGRTPNGSTIPRRRPPPRNANPLVQRKKAPRPKPLVAGGQKQGGATSTKAFIKAEPSQPSRDIITMPYGDTTPSLFSQPPSPGSSYTDIPVVITKKALLEGIQHHVARFASRRPIDPRNEDQFEKPVYLLRQDVRAPTPGTPEWAEMEAEMARRAAEGADDAQRNAAKDLAKAEIAPSLAKKKAKPMKKKMKEARTKNDSEASKKKWQLKYEESMPWHLEDAEKKAIWMGTYEAASSDTWTQLKYEETPKGPRYVLTPLHKWYKFGPKTRLDPEMVRLNEERVKMTTAQPSFMDAFIKNEAKQEEEERDYKNAQVGGGKKMFAGTFENIDDLQNDEEMDFEEDWADDEAPAAIEGDEADVKHVEEKLKRDQLKANFFGLRSTADYLEDERRENERQRLLLEEGRKTALALVKREGKGQHQDPNFQELEDDTDSAAEAEKERIRKEDEAKETAAATSAKQIKSEPGSRNNTPGHRPGKHPEPMHKLAQNLKRPGSPNLSEASGNESTAARKKVKLKNPLSKLAAGGGSRSGSPAPSMNGGRPAPSTNRSFAAGSGSDTEGGGPRRLKLTSPRSPTGSPGPSRLPSRAGSPAPAPASARSGPLRREFPATAAELRPFVPEGGITMKDLVKQFTVSGKDQQKQLIVMVREIAIYDKHTGLLNLKPLPAGGSKP